jgi:nitroimidazol reductase NimA-like FMN-containing flavoprotein (pyridoxamine 5'-phosphate oxidase superfamily)
LIPESHAPILESKAVAHLATVGPDGAPQSTPVWFDWDGERLILNTNKWRKKYRNIVRNPRVAVSIANPDKPLPPRDPGDGRRRPRSRRRQLALPEVHGQGLPIPAAG